ncbi:MAG: IS1 family transposase [Raineya sp.]|nr:IS1 family transposase [Raineya sp.]MDW8295675.1 IS1 family transposase [Raineya sp.]
MNYGLVEQKSQERWIVYTYAPETDEILAYQIGERNATTIKQLYVQLKDLQYVLHGWT